ILSFFFQAEDGIRDLIVTGVQTCALPIYRVKLAAARGVHDFRGGRVRKGRQVRPALPWRHVRASGHRGATDAVRRRGASTRHRRSEERRVGKEGRSRWGPEEAKKNREESA